MSVFVYVLLTACCTLSYGFGQQFICGARKVHVPAPPRELDAVRRGAGGGLRAVGLLRARRAAHRPARPPPLQPRPPIQ